MQYQESLRMLQIVRQHAGPVFTSEPPVPLIVPALTGGIVARVERQIEIDGKDHDPSEIALSDELRECIPFIHQGGFPLEAVTLSASFALFRAIDSYRLGAGMLETDEKPKGQLLMDISKGMRVVAEGVLGLYNEDVAMSEDLEIGEKMSLHTIYESIKNDEAPYPEKAKAIMVWYVSRLNAAMMDKNGFVTENENGFAIMAGGETGRVIYRNVYPIAERVVSTLSR